MCRWNRAWILMSFFVAFFAIQGCGSDTTGEHSVSSCEDGVQSGEQTDVDCGGPNCEPCELGQMCEVNEDCNSNACAQGICVEPACNDGAQTGDQTDVDCGGEHCPGCPTGANCGVDGDCASNQCDDGICVITACEDLDCPEGTSCYRGQCYDECATSAHCGDDSRCIDGRCAPLSCEGVVCDTGEACYDGLCYPQCESAEDCEHDTASCEEGACVVPNCVDDSVDINGEECPLLDFTTEEAEGVEATEATFVGEIFELPLDPPAEHGFCWSNETDEPGVGGDDVECVSLGLAEDTGRFTYRAEGLAPGTRYHVRAVFAHDIGSDDELHQDVHYGPVVDVLTAAPPVTDVEATQGESLDYVDINWEAVDGATGYRVERDGSTAGTVDANVAEFRDESAGGVPAPNAPTGVTASAGDYGDVVVVQWDDVDVQVAPVHEYRVIAIYPDTEAASSEAAQGWRDSEGLAGYEVEVDGEWVDVGMNTEYTDADAPAPSFDAGEVSATEGAFTDRVQVSLSDVVAAAGATVNYRVRAINSGGPGDASDPATGFRGVQDAQVELYRDGTLIATLAMGDDNYDDFGAAAGGVPEAPVLSASSGIHFDYVELQWSVPSVPHGSMHVYTAVVVDGGLASAQSDPASGFRGGVAIDHYEVRIDGGSWTSVGNVVAHQDHEAPAPSINDPGNVTASDGLHADYVALEYDDSISVSQGDVRSYEVRAVNATGSSSASNSDDGHRGVGTPSVQWQRSVGTADADYADISGAVTPTYQDADAPADGSQRFYRIAVSAAGAATEYTDAASGFRATLPVVATVGADYVGVVEAIVVGELVDPGLPETNAHGLCVGTSPLPEPGSADCNDLGSTDSAGQFNYEVDGLDPDTTYYARAYATTNAGTVFGDDIQFQTVNELHFTEASDWEMGSPTPYHLWSGLLEMEWTNDTPSGNTGLRFNGVDGEAGGTPQFYAVNIDVSGFNEMSVYTRKDRHSARFLQIRIDGVTVYNSGQTHEWTERTFDISGHNGVITIELGVETSSGDGDWSAGFSDLKFTP